MRKIGVHFDERVETALQALCKTGAIGRSQTGFGSATKNRKSATVLGRPPFGEVCGAVRAPVVDNEYVDARNGLPGSLKNLDDVLGFVVSGENDQRLHARNCRRRNHPEGAHPFAAPYDQGDATD
jgi:hypothetical protein